MDATKSQGTKNQLPLFEERPYGGRLKLNLATQLVVISPRTNTAAGIKNESLKGGLRGHEGEATEHIKILRYADDPTVVDHISSVLRTGPIIYRYEDQDGKINEKRFGIGDQFLSVDDNGRKGFWHVIENDSDRPVMLMVTVTTKPG